jgi:hypothetical protein
MRKNLGVETGLGAINILGVDSGVDFYCLNFSLALASNTLVYKVIYKKKLLCVQLTCSDVHKRPSRYSKVFE